MENTKLKPFITSELPLKLFFFLVKPTTFFSIEDIEICLGYDLEVVFRELKNVYNSRVANLTIKPIGSLEVKKVLTFIENNHETKKPVEFKFVEPTKTKKEMDLAYICNLKYAKDNFTDILDDTDKEALKTIINKIDKHLAYDTK